MATRRSARPRQRHAPRRFLGPTLTATLEPRTASPTETWLYTLPGVRSGITIGDLEWAVFYVFLLVDKNGWPRAVRFRFPHARWFGMRSQSVTLADPSEAPK